MTTKQEKSEIVKNYESKKEVALPDYMAGVAMETGLLEIESEDLQMSSISLVQGNHPSKRTLDNVKDGDFVDMMTGKNYGPSIEIIVCKNQKTWSRKEGRENTGFSLDGRFWNDGIELTDQEHNWCMEYNFFVLISGDLNPVPSKIKFKRSSRNAGKSLMNFLNIEEKSGRSMYLKRYKVGSEPVAINGNDVRVMTVQPSVFVSEHEFKAAKEVVSSIAGIKIKSSDDDESSVDVVQID
ncbi:MAG: hypothetical protein O2963_00045 [Proteobacteria bacterium]|nr:hypothetical protein [Pseudomonadota bacterium]